VRQRAGIEVGDDLFDDRVSAVIGFGGQHRQRRVGEYRVVTPLCAAPRYVWLQG
jgi:hypothetical protein